MTSSNPPRLSVPSTPPSFNWANILPESPRHGVADLALQFLALEPLARIAIVRDGVPTKLFNVMAEHMQMPRGRVLAWLGIPEAAIRRKSHLGACESEKILDLARLIGQVQRIVLESGEPQGFDAAAWLAVWLKGPNPALGGKAPGELLDTAEGRVMVGQVIARMQSGAYS